MSNLTMSPAHALQCLGCLVVSLFVIVIMVRRG
jgi:hypothetical protein